jgi:hypothetical protein
MLQVEIAELRVGDRVVSDGRYVGDSGRAGEVLEVLGESGHERCRVRWEDGHETVLYAGTDVRVERPRRVKG